MLWKALTWIQFVWIFLFFDRRVFRNFTTFESILRFLNKYLAPPLSLVSSSSFQRKIFSSCFLLWLVSVSGIAAIFFRSFNWVTMLWWSGDFQKSRTFSSYSMCSTFLFCYLCALVFLKATKYFQICHGRLIFCQFYFVSSIDTLGTDIFDTNQISLQFFVFSLLVFTLLAIMSSGVAIKGFIFVCWHCKFLIELTSQAQVEQHSNPAKHFQGLYCSI